MNLQEEALSTVPSVLLKTLSPDKAQRTQAEEYLKNLYNQQGYPILLLRIIERHSQGPTEPDVSIRKAAAVDFKNLIKKRWCPEEDDPLSKDPELAAFDKQAVKESIVNIMCNVPSDVQKVLSEALTLISNYDFPAQWQTLLPEMVNRFASQDFHMITGVLLSANAIFKRFRYAEKTNDLYLELKYCLDTFSSPLTELFLFIGTNLEHAAGAGDKPRLATLTESARLVCRIFFSLNWQDIPEFFEDNLDKWMPQFMALLNFRHPALEDESEEERPGPLEGLHTAIVQNVTLYADKYDEEFAPYVSQFAMAVWELLNRSGTSASKPKYDSLVTTSMRFLSSLFKKQMHYEMFNQAGLLRHIIDTIVVPNLRMREDDSYLFEDNATEYIQRDMEGSDQDTRRRCSCDLVRSMGMQFDDQVTAIAMEYVTNLLQHYITNPEDNWPSKDAAIHLMLALTVRAESAFRGVSALNEKINVMDFFTTHILPELQNTNVNRLQIVRADCLKFLTTFRNQFAIEAIRAVMPLLINHLGSLSEVVQTYAALCIERFLMVKDKNVVTGQVVRRLSREELRPYLQALFTSLFAVLEPNENEYVMKCIMRLLSVVQEDIVPVTAHVLDKITNSLARVCKNPSNPNFNHYLFESIASLVNAVCRTNPSATSDFENLLFPPFQAVLSMDVAEFTPYVFQILAQLLLYRPDGMSPAFAALLPPVLSPAVWERKANVPALVLLLQAYITKGGSQIVEHLNSIMGIFQTLHATKAHEEQAYGMIFALLDHQDDSVVDKYLRPVVEIGLNKVHRTKSNPRTVRLFIHFLGFLIGKKGPAKVVGVLEGIQSGLTRMILQNVWLPNVGMAQKAGGMEAKNCLIGMTRLLCEYPDLQSDMDMWGQLLAAAVTLASPDMDKPKGGADLGDDEDDHLHLVTGEAAFSKLHFAGAQEQDHFPTVPDATTFLVQELHQLMTAYPGRFNVAIQKSLDQPKMDALMAICAKAGIRFQ